MFYLTVHRRILLLFVGFWTVLPALAQRKIENIRAEAHQDTIVLTYDLVGTQPGEQVKIRFFCWNGFNEMELKATEGYTMVGRGKHQLKWRVLDEDKVDILAGDSITFTIRADVPTADRPGTSPSDRKALLFSELTAKTELYIEQLYDQAVLFRDFGDRPFDSRSALTELQAQMKAFNKTYQNLLIKHHDFETTIETLWGSAVKTKAETFFADLLGAPTSPHQKLLDSYNKVLALMYDVANRNYKGRSKKALIQEIRLKIAEYTKNPEGDRQRLRNQAKDLYKQLPV